MNINEKGSGWKWNGKIGAERGRKIWEGEGGWVEARKTLIFWLMLLLYCALWSACTHKHQFIALSQNWIIDSLVYTLCVVVVCWLACLLVRSHSLDDKSPREVWQLKVGNGSLSFSEISFVNSISISGYISKVAKHICAVMLSISNVGAAVCCCCRTQSHGMFPQTCLSRSYALALSFSEWEWVDQ